MTDRHRCRDAAVLFGLALLVSPAAIAPCERRPLGAVAGLCAFLSAPDTKRGGEVVKEIVDTGVVDGRGHG